MYERDGLLLPHSDQPQVDAKFAELLDDLKLGWREVYKDLAVSPENIQVVTDAWHNGEDADLHVQEFDSAVIEERLEACVELKRQVRLDKTLDHDLKKAYAWRIDEERANLCMLQASYQGDQERFKWWNKYIYGEVDDVIYHAAIDHFAHVADVLLGDSTQPDSVKQAAQGVADMLADMRGYRELLQPDSEAFTAVRDDHFRARGYYALLFAGVEMPQSGKVDQLQGDPILRHIVEKNLQSNYAIVDAAGATWGVSHQTESVERPARYNMPWQRYVGLGPGHEIGSHLLEAVNGKRGPVGLFARGLEKSERNEGRAVIREQVPYRSFDEFGETVRWRDILRRHVAIGYAAGTSDPADQAHRSFEVWQFINTIDSMYQAKLHSTDIDTAKSNADAKTDALLLRALKGTDGKGGAYYKDKLYLEANIACWLEAAMHGPKRISDGDLFKGDITNPRHIYLMQKFGLLPKGE